MTLKAFDEKKFNKRLFREVFVPNGIKMVLYFIGLKYMVQLGLLKESSRADLKLTITGIMGVYIGITIYRMYLEIVLPNLEVTLEDVDEMTKACFPKKESKLFRFWDRD